MKEHEIYIERLTKELLENKELTNFFNNNNELRLTLQKTIKIIEKHYNLTRLFEKTRRAIYDINYELDDIGWNHYSKYF